MRGLQEGCKGGARGMPVVGKGRKEGCTVSAREVPEGFKGMQKGARGSQGRKARGMQAGLQGGCTSMPWVDSMSKQPSGDVCAHAAVWSTIYTVYSADLPALHVCESILTDMLECFTNPRWHACTYVLAGSPMQPEFRKCGTHWSMKSMQAH